MHKKKQIDPEYGVSPRFNVLKIVPQKKKISQEQQTTLTNFLNLFIYSIIFREIFIQIVIHFKFTKFHSFQKTIHFIILGFHSIQKIYSFLNHGPYSIQNAIQFNKNPCHSFKNFFHIFDKSVIEHFYSERLYISPLFQHARGVINESKQQITKVLGIGKTPPPPCWEKFPNNPVFFFECFP